MSLVRTASRLKSCKDCFITSFENDVLSFIRQHGLFSPGQRVAVCVSGGKDSAVLLHVLYTLNERENLRLSLHLLAVDEGIKGYRDHALATVKRNSAVYGLPLHIVSYDSLYQGWTMDRIAKVAADHARTERRRTESKKREEGAGASSALQPSSVERKVEVSSSRSARTCACSGSPALSCASSSSSSSSPPVSIVSSVRKNQAQRETGDGDTFSPSENRHVHVAGGSEVATATAFHEEEDSAQNAETPGQSGGFTHSCTFCGIFRRQAFERGAQDIQADVLCTGHNADDGAETVLMNLLRGDTQRLPASAAPMTGSKDGVGIVRVKPLLASFQREVVLYAHFNRLDYFATECTYSGAAYRGLVRGLLCALQGAQQQQRIVDLLHAAQSWIPPAKHEGEKETPGSCFAAGDAHAISDTVRRETESSGLPECGAPSSAVQRDKGRTEGSGKEKTEQSDVASAEHALQGVNSSKKRLDTQSEFPKRDTLPGKEKPEDLAPGECSQSSSSVARRCNLRPCVSCGSWTKNDFCRACDLVNALNQNKLQFVGMNSRQRQKLMEGTEGPKSAGKIEGGKRILGNGSRSISQGSLAW